MHDTPRPEPGSATDESVHTLTLKPQQDVSENTSADNIHNITSIISKQLSMELAIHNERVAQQLVDSTKNLASELVQANEKVAHRLADYNALLANELATTNREIAEKLVISTREVASQLSNQNEDIARKIELATVKRFEKQKTWSWSLIITNALICLILLFFTAMFSRYAIQQAVIGHG